MADTKTRSTLINDSHAALSVDVLGREKLCTIHGAKKNYIRSLGRRMTLNQEIARQGDPSGREGRSYWRSGRRITRDQGRRLRP